jgi:hypothetical protein
MGKPIVRYADRYVVMSQWNNLLLSDQDEIFNLAHVRMIRQVTSAALAEHPDGIANLAFIRHGMQPAEKATTQELIKLYKVDLAKLPILATVVVIEGHGIMGAAMRTLVRAMITLSGFHKIEIRATASEGIRAVLPRLRASDGTRPSRAELEEAIKSVRAMLDAQRAATGPQAQH